MWLIEYEQLNFFQPLNEYSIIWEDVELWLYFLLLSTLLF